MNQEQILRQWDDSILRVDAFRAFMHLIEDTCEPVSEAVHASADKATNFIFKINGKCYVEPLEKAEKLSKRVMRVYSTDEFMGRIDQAALRFQR